MSEPSSVELVRAGGGIYGWARLWASLGEGIALEAGRVPPFLPTLEKSLHRVNRMFILNIQIYKNKKW